MRSRSDCWPVKALDSISSLTLVAIGKQHLVRLSRIDPVGRGGRTIDLVCSKETIISKAVTMVVDNHSDLNVTATFSYGYAVQPRYSGHLRRMQDTEATSPFSARSGYAGQEDLDS